MPHSPKKEKILVIEGDESFGQRIIQALKDEGYDAVLYKDGKQGLEAILHGIVKMCAEIEQLVETWWPFTSKRNIITDFLSVLNEVFQSFQALSRLGVRFYDTSIPQVTTLKRCSCQRVIIFPPAVHI